jgi:hypothetical protein
MLLKAVLNLQRTAETSLLNSVICNIKASHGNNTDKVTVTVMAYYHKDIDATELTANLFINKAKVTVKGVPSTLVGSFVFLSPTL